MDPRTPPSNTSARNGAGTPAHSYIVALKARWPDVDVDAEMEKALDNRRRKNGPKTQLDLVWFEKHWLPLCGPAYRGEAPAPSKAEQWQRECPNWPALVEDTQYGPGGAYPATKWKDLHYSAMKEVWHRYQRLISGTAMTHGRCAG